jgi:outer membrane protein TolC
MKKIRLMIFLGLVVTVTQVRSQTSFSLEEAVDYALKNNFQVRKSQNEIWKAKKKVWETTAMGLPQASGNVSYQKFIEQPVNLMPARIFNPQAPDDMYIPVKFGTEQNMKWNLSVNQLIFSGSYITGLYSSRVYKKISEYASVKTKRKIKELVVQAYVNAVLADKSLEILNGNIETVKRNLFEVRKMFENGLVEETDVTQLEITLKSLENQRDYLQNMHKTAYEMLNFTMGREPGEVLVLSDDTSLLTKKALNLNLLKGEFNPENHIDYLIAGNKTKAKKLMIRFEQSQMLPTIAAFYSYGKNAYNNDFKFFDKDQAWYEQSLVGVSINIPIFDGLARQKRIGQARMDYENAKMDLENTRRQLILQYQKLRNEYTHAIDNYYTAEKNLQLAGQIEQREQIKYKEGVGNSFQLNMARLQLYQTQQQYIQAIGDLMNKKIQLENFLNQNL